MAIKMSKRLTKFYLPGLNEMGAELGEGSYAVVVEFQLHGLKCAGKKLHRQLCYSNPEEREKLVSRFEEECQLLSYVRHPNIVQFLGLSYDKETRTPILVMEFLETTLTACLALNGVLPDEFSYSILNDVATALCYLHSQPEPIIHRDLTTNNILLTSDKTAKISDLGMAKILNLSYLQKRQMTTCPGASSYMPPEALSDNATYDCSLDIFAMGVLILHVFCGEWPIPNEPNRIDPQDPTKLLPLTEAERRAKFISKISSIHPLMNLMEKSLSNYPPHRPTAQQILAEVRAQYYLRKVHKLQLAVERDQMHTENETQTRDHKKQVDDMQQTLHILTQEKKSLQEIVTIKDETLRAREKQLSAMREQIQAMQEEISAQGTEISVKDRLLQQPPIENKDVHLELQLKHCKNFGPKSIVGNPNCIVYRDTLYVGAGYSENKGDRHLVYSYDQLKDAWYQLPPTPHELFGLGYLEEGIVAVGGLDSQTGAVVADAYIFESKSKSWKKTIPGMPTARFRVTIISHSQLMAVCGGIQDNSTVSNRVEVFLPVSRCWYSAPTIAVPCALAKPVVIGNHFYLVGGYKKWRTTEATNAVQSITISDILSTKGRWRLIQDTPNNRSLPINMAGTLVVIGGWNEGPSDAIFVFSEKSNEWIKIGTWPVAFRSGGSATLPSGEPMVIGGIRDPQALFQVVVVSLISQ